MQVKLIPSAWFIEWMDSRGKLGSQNKVPRVMSDSLYENWLDFLDEKFNMRKSGLPKS
jgi:hypothetical protein